MLPKTNVFRSVQRLCWMLKGDNECQLREAPVHIRHSLGGVLLWPGVGLMAIRRGEPLTKLWRSKKHVDAPTQLRVHFQTPETLSMLLKDT